MGGPWSPPQDNIREIKILGSIPGHVLSLQRRGTQGLAAFWMVA